MRNILYGFILGAVCNSVLPAFAQPDTLWSAQLSLAGSSVLYGGTAVADGYVLAGYAIDGGTNRDLLIAKVSFTGQILWTRLLGTPRNEEAWGVVQLPDGSFFVAGFGVNETNTRNLVLAAGVGADGDSLWWRTYANNGQARGRDVVLTGDGNVAICGYGLSSDGVASDMWLLKCEADGDTLWTRMFGGDQTDVGYRLCRRPSGGLALVGTTRSIGGGQDDPWLVLTNSAGNMTHQFTFGGSGQQFGNACTATGEFIFVGGRGSSTSGPAFVAKCSDTGDSLWTYYYGAASSAQLRGLVPQIGGGVLCVGADMANGPSAWLMSVGPGGDADWTWSMNVGVSELNGAIPAQNGALAFGARESNGWVLRLGPSSVIAGTVRESVTGNPIEGVHVTTVGSEFTSLTDAEGRYTITRAPDSYTLAAFGACVETDTFGMVQTYPDSIVLMDLAVGAPVYEQTQTSLNITAYNHLPTPSPLYIYNRGSGGLEFEMQAHSVFPPTDWLSLQPEQGVIAAGDSLAVMVVVHIDTSDVGAIDLFGYLDVHTNSCPDSIDYVPVLVTVLDAGDPVETPRAFALHAAYPNPFNPQTTLTFSLPRETEVSIAIYNVSGQHVRDLIRSRLSAGEHRAVFDASDLPTGLYLARLTCGDFVASQKLLLLK